MSRWFRFYADAMRDPKVAKLSDQQFRLWMELLSVACEHDGKIPDAETLKAMLKRRLDHLLRGLEALLTSGLIECLGAEYEPSLILGCERSNRPPADEWRRIRERIFARDNYTCAYCGVRGVNMECDHIFPVSRGGSHDDENLTTACLKCNRSKRDKTLLEWKGHHHGE